MDIKSNIIYLKPGTLQTVDSFKAFGELVKKQASQSMLIVGTALSGVTRILEGIVEDHQKGDLEGAMKKLNLLKAKYYELGYELFDKEHVVFDELNDHFVSIEWDLEEPKHEDIDYAYDQTVAVGELLSTLMLATYLQQIGVDIHWMDARDIILADDVFRNGNVLELETKERVQKHLAPLLANNKSILTQALLGCTTENYSIMLGQENGISHSVLALQSYFDIDQLLVWDGK